MKVDWNTKRLLMAPMGDEFSGGGGGISSWRDDDEDEVIDENDLVDDEDDDEDEDDDDDDEGESSGRKGGFSEEKLAAAITAGLGPVLGGNRGQQQQLSPEQIAEKLGKPKLDTNLIKLLRDPEVAPEEAHKALAQLLDQQEQYLLRAASMYAEGQVEKLNPQIQAVQEHMRAQRQEQFAQSVVHKFPALKGKGHIVKQAMRYLAQNGFQGSETQARKEVAKTARDIIRQIDPNFSLKGGKPSFMSPRSGGGGGHQQKMQRKKSGFWDAAFPVK